MQQFAPSPQQLFRAVSRIRSAPIPTTRLFSTLPALRPTLQPIARTASRGTPAQLLVAAVPAIGSVGVGVGVPDLVPRATAISAHPALGGAAQLRCGPRPTMGGATRLVQKRRVGFLARARTKKGRKILARRRAKGRYRLSA